LAVGEVVEVGEPAVGRGARPRGAVGGDHDGGERGVAGEGVDGLTDGDEFSAGEDDGGAKVSGIGGSPPKDILETL
jgi:hypothetical protein